MLEGGGGGGGAKGLLNKGGGSNRLPVEFPQVQTSINYCVPNIFMIACLCHLGNPLLLAYPVKCPGSGKNTSLERERDGS